MKIDVLVCIHSFSRCENGRNRRGVVRDRILKADSVCEHYEAIGATVGVAFLGNKVLDTGVTTSEMARNVAEEVAPELTRSRHSLLADKYGRNTIGEIRSATEVAEEYDVELVVSVSSADHTPRISRDWTEYERDAQFTATVVSSDKKYSATGFEPFILEGGEFADFVPVLSGIFGVPSECRADAATKIDEVLQEYG